MLRVQDVMRIVHPIHRFASQQQQQQEEEGEIGQSAKFRSISEEGQIILILLQSCNLLLARCIIRIKNSTPGGQNSYPNSHTAK